MSCCQFPQINAIMHHHKQVQVIITTTLPLQCLHQDCIPSQNGFHSSLPGFDPHPCTLHLKTKTHKPEARGSVASCVWSHYLYCNPAAKHRYRCLHHVEWQFVCKLWGFQEVCLGKVAKAKPGIEVIHSFTVLTVPVGCIPYRYPYTVIL